MEAIVKQIYQKYLKVNIQKDFGTGFYCTILKEQANKWAKNMKLQ